MEELTFIYEHISHGTITINAADKVQAVIQLRSLVINPSDWVIERIEDGGVELYSGK